MDFHSKSLRDYLMKTWITRSILSGVLYVETMGTDFHYAGLRILPLGVLFEIHLRATGIRG